MASKKASARERATDFLASIGTAGGPIGSPGLVLFGANDLATQIQSGNVDEYAPIRMRAGGPVVGKPGTPPPAMPSDLDASYLKLNLPGSPLPRMALLTPQAVRSAENVQEAIAANTQQMLLPMMPLTGQLPVGFPLPKPNNKGARK